ncbi:uncharacterized protein LOC130807322 isoform X2 [Amaranthus tricolor]|uniref:uncharacterized protein LOC130807322 isoform X2 n=1 Tax=Amaranthus tricolor TaxID=29722 RepID=UPI0025860358|nr:uncharacterized protein LOC130807322 isoform X2 [Amaranthus tricolor]XP_057528475.1 uncharacterized protein LOC130807322 isoform X2 [Amaranthus tricolor]
MMVPSFPSTTELNVQSEENGETDTKTDVLVEISSAIVPEEPSEDESEEEDVDFNPFLKESLSEASSSLSSEAEGFDTDVINSRGVNVIPVDKNLPGTRPFDAVDEGECGGNSTKDFVLVVEQENEKVLDDEDRLNSGTNVIEDVVEEGGKVVSSRDEPASDLNDEDAICKRTRARYSLASFTLDELETFLQETDDEDDNQNVDEEEEYRKFLHAVLNGKSGDNEGNIEGNDDDDDEDNDADFEIEIEEALESDVDDCIEVSVKEAKFDRAGRRPETRQKGRQKANAQNKVTKQGKQPLRPLVPVMSTATGASVPCLVPRSLALQTTLHFPSYVQDCSLIGFKDHQIGQLYCLIYEHVQLLVQVYSLCALEPSRQHIASQMKGLLAELLHKRDLVLAWRKDPYPTSCFLPSYTIPSVSVENKKNLSVGDSGASTDYGQGSQWLPSVGSSVLSVLDVSPLKFVGKYIDDVSNAVQEHQRRCLETTNVYLEKQPLFPLPISSFPEADCSISKSNDPSRNTSVASPINKVPKKTLAATLVENTKKQSVASVPLEIAKLAQAFCSLFNPALFPHKPPSSAVANRVLFTDAEDVLLAMGIMEYNNDWKAIRQRFLPCKLEHQIFVRAKNRCSSKAPENPIKSVRKMKTSPLTEEEKALIQKGLKMFKLDWTSVWRAVVPYRDPNLLPRQWRIAIGTQKSYKADSAKRERHRIYELKRRRAKATAMNNSITGSEKENDSGEDYMDNENEAFVHEAFLADWRPPYSGLDPPEVPSASLKPGFLSNDLRVARSCGVLNGADTYGNLECHSDKGHMHGVSTASGDPLLIHRGTSHPYLTSGYPPAVSSSNAFKDSLLLSKKTGKSSSSNLVKLAPELPPVKLPPAVRIISQASLRNSQPGSSTEVGATGPGPEKTLRDPTGFDCSANMIKPVQGKSKISISTSATLISKKDGLMNDRFFAEERVSDLDPHMHPLLYRTTDEGHLPCFPVNSPMKMPTFSFFPAAQHQMNVTLLQQPCSGGQSLIAKEDTSASISLDFHPLLQREKFGANSDAGLSGSLLNTNLELSRDGYGEDIVYHAGATAARMAAATRPTSHTANGNGLDLDIQLSSASKRRKVSSAEGPERGLSFPSISGTKVVENVEEISGMHHELSPLAELVDLAVREHSDVALPCNSDSLSYYKLDGITGVCISDNVGDHPLAEIVMEQEELSDSDEEMEDVEFEREEMTDSDEEESGAEQNVDLHRKSDTVGNDCQNQLSKSLASGVSEGTQLQRKGNNSGSTLKGTGKGHSKGSWLSLNSRGSHHKSPARTKKTESCEGVSVPSYPNRYCKKGNSGSKDVSTEQNADISEEGPFSHLSRKSRKPASKGSSPSRVDVPIGNTCCTEKDGKF